MTVALSRHRLEQRNNAADSGSLAGRMEYYRDRHPVSDPQLIVDPDREVPVPERGCIPEITRDQCTAQTLRAAVLEHGSLIVRGLFSEETVAGMREIIDGVLDACGSSREVRRKTRSVYYHPPANAGSIMPQGDIELSALRQFSAASGSALCIEASSVAEMLLEFYEQHGLKELVTGYLGEAPCLSAKKWVLRRSFVPSEVAGWHQDGAFMGTHINTINLWIPLTECGADTGAPGMDVVPARLNRLISSDGADFNWSVHDDKARFGFGSLRPEAPLFHVGDAFFFDHFHLHRTQSDLDFTKQRYAIETWFFGCTSFPKDQVPIRW